MQKRVTGQSRFKEGHKCYGFNACMALFKNRPQTIIRAYIGSNRVAQAKDLMRHCAAAKLAYHIVQDAELDQIAGSKHHEGLCLMVTEPEEQRWPELLHALRRKESALIVFAPEVTNPHNIGAIIRSSAHFGAHAVALEANLWPLSGAAYRVAEGGAESVALVRIAEENAALVAARDAGFTLMATSSHAKQSAATLHWPKHVVLLLGAEGEGLRREAQQGSHQLVTIPGTGHVESLNVSAAAAVLLAYWQLSMARG